ncbi:MAG: branched-chain-amino-acid transaminase [Alphaproteobacteria bacterium]|nr:branched-chain-amino-acid transaminase [Alphaproteobacteria bacterium]
MSGPQFLYLDGEIVPFASATVHISAPGVKYGIGVFEGLRGYWNDADEEMYVFRLTDHVRRLKQSMKLLRLEDTYSVEFLEDAVLSMIRANKFRTTVQMRIMALLDGIDGMRADAGPISLSVYGHPRETKPFQVNGVTAGTSSWARPPDNVLPPRIKCNANYLNGRLAEIEARANGYDRPVLLNTRGKVSEGPGATLFIIKDGAPITPDTASDLLESITRATLIELFETRFGLQTEQRTMDRTEIYTADEAFFCGTLAEVTPILSLDGLPVGNGEVGPLTRALQENYRDLVHGYVDDRPEWRVPVYG